jgi:hypothetical protein
MNAAIRHIPLIRGQSDVVAAKLRDRIQDHNLQDWQTRWLPGLADSDAGQDAKTRRPVLFIPGGGALDWFDCVAAERSAPDTRASFAIECEGTTQGMIAVRCETEGKSRSEARGRGFIEIEFLESAPWNRRDLSENPRYRGVGRMLVVTAIAFSLSKGFEGPVFVQALSGSAEFFEKCGMTDFGPDPKHPQLRLFEMTADQADVFVATTFTGFHRLLSNGLPKPAELGRGWSTIERWFQ